MRDLLKRFAELPVKDLYLVEIEAGREKLEIIGKLAQRMLDKANVPIQLHLTFVGRLFGMPISARHRCVLAAWTHVREDEQIPLTYGCIGQETTGAGGEVDVSQVDIEMVGINHLNWTTKITIDIII